MFRRLRRTLWRSNRLIREPLILLYHPIVALSPDLGNLRVLKTELIHHRRFQTRQDAKTEIFEYLEGFSNRQRRHSTRGYLSPVEFEQQVALVNIAMSLIRCRPQTSLPSA